MTNLKGPAPGEPLIPTRGAMDPPTKPLYWPIHLGLSFSVCLLLAAIYAIAFLQSPTLFWLWPISVGTIILTAIWVAKEAME
jgi:hypothetical protein